MSAANVSPRMWRPYCCRKCAGRAGLAGPAAGRGRPGRDGTTALGNGLRGIAVSTDAATASERALVTVTISFNLVGGNGATGIALTGPDAVLGAAEPPYRSVIAPDLGNPKLGEIGGNVIGLTVDRDAVRPNAGWGIELLGLANTRMGGNEIAGNEAGGIHARTNYADIEGNDIGEIRRPGPGPGPGTTFAAGSGGPGIHLQGSWNVVGEFPASETGETLHTGIPNTIAHSAGPGILVTAAGATQSVENTIRSNAFLDNTGIPIDLSLTPAGDGPNPKNPGASGTGNGPNHLLNTPTITRVVRSGTTITITGELADLTEWGRLGRYTIDAYEMGTCAAPHVRTRHVGRALPSILSDGAFTITLQDPDEELEFFAVTATAPSLAIAETADTSEFSVCSRARFATGLAAQASAGFTSLAVAPANTGRFPVGDQVALDPDGPSEEVHTVTGHGSLLLGEPLAFDHPAGTTVLHLGTPPDTEITFGPAEGAVITEPTASFDFESPDAEASFECSLDGADWAACTVPHALAGLLDGPHTFAVRAVLEDGRFDPSPAERTFSVSTGATDTTPPVITFGGLRDYGLLETVTLSCAFDDPESGIDAAACTVPGPGSPAWTFGPGPEPVSGWAINGAGLMNLETGAFSVTATFDDLCILTEQFSSRKHEKDLCDHLRNAEKGAARGKARQAAKHLDEYLKKVAKDRKAFTAAERATLVEFARSLVGAIGSP